MPHMCLNWLAVHSHFSNCVCVFNLVRPHDHVIQPLGERDVLLSGEQLNELKLVYHFHVVCTVPTVYRTFMCRPFHSTLSTPFPNIPFLFSFLF